MKRNIFLACLFLIAASGAFGQANPVIRISQDPANKKLDVFINDSLFTSLLYTDSLKKPVLFPVYAAGNIRITRGWPLDPRNGEQIDHPHQTGVWFNYGDVNGADYWNNSTRVDSLKKLYGTIRLQKVINVNSAAGKGEFSIVSLWSDRINGVVAEETTRFSFRVEGNIRTIDRETTVRAMKDILFRDNKEGLFAIRVSRELEAPSQLNAKVYFKEPALKDGAKAGIPGGIYESSAGVKDEAVFATRSEWLKLSGKMEGRTVSVVIIDHPANINYPGFWMARGYGLFAVNPLGAEFYTNGKEKLNFRLKRGENVTFKHRLVLAGELTDIQIKALADSFKAR